MKLFKNGKLPLLDQKTTRQLIRYIIVGISQNGFGFLIYLLLTWLGMSPQLVVSLFYPVGIAISYFGNKKYTFGNKGKIAKTGARFIILYLSGYVINMATLYIFYDTMQFPHQIVQIGTMAFLVAYFFIFSKIFVFHLPDTH